MTTTTSSKNLDWATLRRLAVEASTDPRTIAKAARGEAVRGLAGHRAREVLVKEGLLPVAVVAAT